MITKIVLKKVLVKNNEILYYICDTTDKSVINKTIHTYRRCYDKSYIVKNFGFDIKNGDIDLQGMALIEQEQGMVVEQNIIVDDNIIRIELPYVSIDYAYITDRNEKLLVEKGYKLYPNAILVKNDIGNSLYTKDKSLELGKKYLNDYIRRFYIDNKNQLIYNNGLLEFFSDDDVVYKHYIYFMTRIKYSDAYLDRYENIDELINSYLNLRVIYDNVKFATEVENLQQQLLKDDLTFVDIINKKQRYNNSLLLFCRLNLEW